MCTTPTDVALEKDAVLQELNSVNSPNWKGTEVISKIQAGKMLKRLL